MHVLPSSLGPILRPCQLEGFAYQVDPYGGCQHLCRYCYALNKARTDWTEEIRTHRDLETQLARELSGLEPQRIYVGWDTDPYQPAEATHHQTRRIMEMLADRGHTVSVLTKSGLVTRDIDLLARMPGSSAGISVAFTNEGTRQLFEAAAPPTEERIRALHALKQAGIPTYALICPVLPFLTDVKALVEKLAGWADSIWVYALSMESPEKPNWRNIEGILQESFPELSGPYRELAFDQDLGYWAELRRELEEHRLRSGLDLRVRIG
ncbi:MAG: radical SAM protein [bacterium]|nr:radical SAM protein [bacterium]